jgi:type I restriction enzyme S subunit
MQEKVKVTVTPRLRFREFRDAAEWEEKALRNVCERIMDGTHFSPKSKHGPRPYLTSKNIRNGQIDTSTVSFISEEEHREIYTRCPVKMLDVLLTKDGANTGNCAINPFDYEFSLLSSVAVLRGNPSQLTQEFLYQSIASERTQSIIHGSMSGQAITRITLERLGLFTILIPSLPEQQQIADCLASLDACVAAQGRKIGALKDHKGGLMQQIFPRKGETVPRLRFPECRNAGEWEDRKLGPMTSKIGSGITPLGGDKTYKRSGRPFIRSQNVGWGHLLLDDVAFIDEETHASFDGTEIIEGDVLLNITGASIGRSAIANARIVGGNVNQHVCIVRVKRGELNPILLNQFLISERGQAQIDSFQAGGNRQGLNFGQIRTLEIPLPPTEEEQQRIASCLFNLDSQIAVESAKLDALKTHKKGLLQQLFPYFEEEL